MENGLKNITLKLKKDFDVDISMFEENFIQKSVQNRCFAVGVPTLEDYADYIDIDRNEPRNLHHSMNVTYTEFFRDSLTYAHLEHWILPRLIDGKTKNREIKIWTAGCATAQEPYSIAMLFGFDDYISKPIEKEYMEKVITRHLYG